MTGPDQTKGVDKDRSELLRLVFDDLFDSLHVDMRELVTDPLFERARDLSGPEAARLAYRRLMFLEPRLPPAQELLADPQQMFAIADWLSLVDPTATSVASIHYGLCLGTVLKLGGDRPELGGYIDELTSMSSIGLFLGTEVGYGSNLAALKTEARFDPESGGFVLNTPGPMAYKFMPNTGLSDIPKIAVVLARLLVREVNCGVFPFLVRISTPEGPCPGIRPVPLPDKPGLALDNGLTCFEEVRLPPEALLSDGIGGFTPDGDFSSSLNLRGRFLESITRIHAGRVFLTSGLLATARASLYATIRYAHVRHSYSSGNREVPLIEYRDYRRTLFGRLAETYAMTFLANHTKAAFAKAASHLDQETLHLVALTKALVSWSASHTIHTCREQCGAQGMFGVNRIADYVGYAQGVVTAEGDNQVLLGQVASWYMTRTQQPPEMSFESDRSRMADPRVLAALLAYREKALAEAAKERLRDRLKSHGTAFEAWNAAVMPATAAARLRGNRLALELMLEAAEDARTPRVGAALNNLATLYGLQQVMGESGWLAARGLITAEDLESATQVIEDLCDDLLPDAALLADGFGVDNTILRAPIAEDDYAKGVFRSLSLPFGRDES